MVSIALPSLARAAFHEPVDASLNGGPDHSGLSIGIADLGGAPGVGWIEVSPAELHVATFVSGSWARLGSAVSTSAGSGHPLSLAAVGAAPVVAWTESTPPGPPAEIVEVARFDGSSWHRLGGSLASTITDNTFESSVMSSQALCLPGPTPCTVAAFGEQTPSFGLHVSSFDGVSWNPAAPLVNAGFTSDLFEVGQIAQGMDGTYVAWRDSSTGAVHVGRLPNMLPAWTDFALGAGAGRPSLALIDGIPYVAWSKIATGSGVVHASRWDPFTDTFKPVGGSIGVPNKLASSPAIAGVAGTPYVAYNQAEVSGPPQAKDLVVRFDGNNWVQIGDPLNHVLSNEVSGPQITTVAGVPYVAWLERDRPPPSPHFEVRVAGYVAPSCAGASVAVGHDAPTPVALACSDGSADALRVLGGPSHGSLSAIAGGSVTYTPALGWAGSDSFTYTGNDGAMDSPAATVTLTVAAASGGPSGGGGARPTLSRLRLAPAFRAASRGASVVHGLPRSRTRHAIGSALTFTLNAPARVVFLVQSERSGVLRGGRCVAGRAARRSRCSRFVPVRGSFSVTGARGRTRVLFSGRIGGYALAPGGYRLFARPVGGATAHADFTIVRT
ncbi:MAG TPA: Ig-like domain-containing protein [Solirubrobacteraceae bacterium]|nr:Ig-like domain-containing protein [Solirubrobacteraceae bacterium]